jgi:hypothetical protein
MTKFAGEKRRTMMFAFGLVEEEAEQQTMTAHLASS